MKHFEKHQAQRIDDTYSTTVLSVNFDDAKRLFRRPLMEIHFAHTLMLERQGILTRGDAIICLSALIRLEHADFSEATFTGECEDFFFFVEKALTSEGDPKTVAKIHTARSRNDVDLTLYRMRIRAELLSLVEAVHGLRRTLLGLARAHLRTLIPAYTHGQPAQPTTLAHYLMAVIECLGRDEQRLHAAFETVNRSPMGACAITTTAFPIDRNYTADLLGFEGLQLNSYGAIAAVDYLAEATSAVVVSLLSLGRFVQDLLVMCSREVNTLRLSDGFVQTSSIMPQKRNPSALEHCRVLASKSLGQAQAVVLSIHNTPFADMVDGEDDLQPLVSQMFDDAQRTVRLLAAVLEKAVFNEKHLREHAYDNFLTATELADTLVREGGLSFRDAHQIVSNAVSATEDPRDPACLVEKVRSEARALLGKELDVSEDHLLTSLDAQHFVESRRHPGGPAECSTLAHITASEEELARNHSWIIAKSDRLRHYPVQLRKLAAEMIARGDGL